MGPILILCASLAYFPINPPLNMSTLPTPPPLSVITSQSPNSKTPLTQNDHNQYRSVSPTAPPYSPITPVMSSTNPHETARYSSPPSQNTPQPPPLIPFSESDNSDAIALRSAISILQIQRQQTLRDLKTLERQKKAAVADPEAFAADALAGKVKTTSQGGLSLGPILEKPPKGSAGECEDSAIESDVDDGPPQQSSRFDPIPGPQNVVRTPPINWAKYHIVGESLDKLHEEQKARPIPGQPRRDGDPLRAPEHIMAAPYNPWTDKLTDSPMRTRSSSKRDD